MDIKVLHSFECCCGWAEHQPQHLLETEAYIGCIHLVMSCIYRYHLYGFIRL